MVPGNIVLDRGPGLHTEREDFGGQNPQFTAKLPIAKLLSPVLLFGVTMQIIFTIDLTVILKKITK